MVGSSSSSYSRSDDDLTDDSCEETEEDISSDDDDTDDHDESASEEEYTSSSCDDVDFYDRKRRRKRRKKEKGKNSRSTWSGYARGNDLLRKKSLVSPGLKGQDDVKFTELVKKKKWQRCPECKSYVEKRDGCLHITCRCRVEFCYRCGAKWTYDHGC